MTPRGARTRPIFFKPEIPARPASPRYAKLSFWKTEPSIKSFKSTRSVCRFRDEVARESGMKSRVGGGRTACLLARLGSASREDSDTPCARSASIQGCRGIPMRGRDQQTIEYRKKNSSFKIALEVALGGWRLMAAHPAGVAQRPGRHTAQMWLANLINFASYKNRSSSIS